MEKNTQLFLSDTSLLSTGISALRILRMHTTVKKIDCGELNKKKTQCKSHIKSLKLIEEMELISDEQNQRLLQNHQQQIDSIADIQFCSLPIIQRQRRDSIIIRVNQLKNKFQRRSSIENKITVDRRRMSLKFIENGKVIDDDKKLNQKLPEPTRKFKLLNNEKRVSFDENVSVKNSSSGQVTNIKLVSSPLQGRNIAKRSLLQMKSQVQKLNLDIHLYDI